MDSRAKLAVLLAMLPLGGCFGTPHLLRPIPSVGDGPSPSIAEVKTEIACELLRYRRDQFQAKGAGGWFQHPYLVTATLTLQVDDYLDVTPTLNFLQPIATATGTRTEIASADIGGQRERTYTETFYIDSSKFKIDDATVASTCTGKRLANDRYSLTGDLKLAEIIENGERSQRSTASIAPDGGGANPSFGSTVEFIVTKSVSALGIQWDLVHFKGPSGSNGLINGKKVTTDNLVIAFTEITPQEPSETSKLMVAIAKLTQVLASDADRKRELSDARIEKKVADDARDKLESTFRGQGRQPKAMPSAALRNAREAATRSQRRLEVATAASDSSDRTVSDARNAVDAAYAGSANGASTSGAVDANRLLQQTMILQSLNIRPR